MKIQVVLAKALQIPPIVGRIAVSVGNAAKSVGSAVNDAKLLITEVAGAGATLAGIGNVTGWQYAAIIGGVAIILAVERQPSGTRTELADKAKLLRTALVNAKATGKFDVMIDDVLKVI